MHLGKIQIFIWFFARFSLSLTIVEDTFARKKSNNICFFARLFVSLQAERDIDIFYYPEYDL